MHFINRQVPNLFPIDGAVNESVHVHLFMGRSGLRQMEF